MTRNHLCQYSIVDSHESLFRQGYPSFDGLLVPGEWKASIHSPFSCVWSSLILGEISAFAVKQVKW